MCVLYRAVLLALLVLGSNAELAAEECENLTTTLQPSDLDKIFGNWVLVGAVATFPSGNELVMNVSSSHVELQLNPDNKTVIYNERNMYLDKSCVTYYSNNTVVDSAGSSLRLLIDSFFKEKDGAVSVYNDSGRVEFYQTCPDCLLMVYSGDYEGTPGRYLLTYKREGKHQDAEELKVALGTHKKHAECLKFAGDGHFNYDGVAELRTSNMDAREEDIT
ncbi:saxitoxin and tetrodotoxin-binding protein 1-like [Centroberyx affinis]|uniref:saxitoxin and tetrodotoxin-binding protein 1-like n=1 Tax=Centroberyx affinis TaxID=166261 RepID=UPI003A5C397E